DDLLIGDKVWFRHAKAGELCERFDELQLIEGSSVEGRHGPSSNCGSDRISGYGRGRSPSARGHGGCGPSVRGCGGRCPSVRGCGGGPSVRGRGGRCPSVRGRGGRCPSVRRPDGRHPRADRP
ncbi:hypothetical protein, partial [Streptomyces sp900116325]|uniref:hypothetical protein n=1 Tax=Streptomyces sp. 900116325 TaxID=3154295 RepID=UPI0033A3E281